MRGCAGCQGDTANPLSDGQLRYCHVDLDYISSVDMLLGRLRI